MTQSQFEKQLKKLLRVRWSEWEDALEELTPKISCLLHGHVYTDTKQMNTVSHLKLVQHIEAAIKEFIPNFEHEEKGKNLDQKM